MLDNEKSASEPPDIALVAMRQPRTAPRARKALQKPEILGWNTSDEQEVEVRRWRGRTEIEAIEALERDFGLYGTFRVRSASGGAYDVEIRDLGGRLNSCGCIDHRANGLGTCKHIEGVMAALKRRGARSFNSAAKEGLPRVEIFLARSGEARPTILRPGRAISGQAHGWLAPFLDPDGEIRPDPSNIAALLDAASSAPPEIRVSRHFGPWFEREKRLLARRTARTEFLDDAGRDGLSDIVKYPLLPYQRDGVLHLALGERALLADDMGLGKTVQRSPPSSFLARLKRASSGCSSWRRFRSSHSGRRRSQVHRPGGARSSPGVSATAPRVSTGIRLSSRS